MVVCIWGRQRAHNANANTKASFTWEKKIHGRDKNPLLRVTRPSWTKSTIKVLLPSSRTWKKWKRMSNSGRQCPSIIWTCISHYRGVDYLRVLSHEATMPCPSSFDLPKSVTPACYCELWPGWKTASFSQGMLHNVHMMYYHCSQWSSPLFNSNAGKGFTPAQHKCKCTESVD